MKGRDAMVGNDGGCAAALRRLAAGDTSALETIYDSLGRDIFTLAIAILRDYQLAQDVMQDTFVKLIAKAYSYDRGNARAWILAITRNLALDRLRHNSFSVSHEDMAEIGEFFDPNALDESIDVYRALGELESDERELVLLKAVTGLSHNEIAEMLNISISASQKRYERALKKLKAKLNAK